jgi:hypothetical protein
VGSNHRPQHYQCWAKGWSGDWYTLRTAISCQSEPAEDGSCHFVWARFGHEVDSEPIVNRDARSNTANSGASPLTVRSGQYISLPRRSWRDLDPAADEESGGRHRSSKAGCAGPTSSRGDGRAQMGDHHLYFNNLEDNLVPLETNLFRPTFRLVTTNSSELLRPRRAQTATP